jgi:hypothetical protein
MKCRLPARRDLRWREDRNSPTERVHPSVAGIETKSSDRSLSRLGHFMFSWFSSGVGDE